MCNYCQYLVYIKLHEYMSYDTYFSSEERNILICVLKIRFNY